MCGIVGYLTDPARVDSLRSKALSALEQLSHRGPDASQHQATGPVWLGHRRLAIIDTSDTANQPMTSHDGRYTIVFNGEIYNFEEVRQQLTQPYPFRTDSDTEVLLAAYACWGRGCLSRLHGMFAFAIWDAKLEQLFLARDRLGVKPLYYTRQDGIFAFSSRPGALMTIISDQPPRLDHQSLRYYLECGYIPAPFSAWQGVRKLEPGTCLVADSESEHLWQYWSLDQVSTNRELIHASEGDLLKQLDQLVERSVRWRMVSSVPVGAFLSGGIDSSLVVATMARQSSRPIKTFSIGFEDPKFDESEYAAAIASYLGTEHQSQKLNPDDFLDLIPDFFKNYDEPFFDYSAFPTMAVSRLASKSVKVVLSGDGGDEGFGGYHYYRIAQLMSWLFRLPRSIRQAVAQGCSLLGHRGRLLADALHQPGRVEAFAYTRSVMKSDLQLLSPELRNCTSSFARLLLEKSRTHPAGLSGGEEAMRLDIASTLPDDYLQKVDVASMAFSLEARDPLLEHSILEWSAQLPLKWKIRQGRNKYLLRKLAYQKVPATLLNRPKMGFSLPLADWLQGKLRPWAEQLLSDQGTIEDLGMDATALRGLWSRQMAGRAQSHTALWTALVLIQFAHTQKSFRA